MATTISGLSAYATSLGKLQAAFKTSDTNGNGTLSQSEFTAAAKSNTGLLNGQNADTTFTKLDGNHDGQLTTAEITTSINLATDIQSVLLQGQQLQTSAYAALLGNTGGSGSTFDTLLGTSGGGSSNNFANLTSSLLGGGSASSSLTSIISGANANTSVSAGLFGGLSAANSALIQNLLSRYTNVDAETASTLTQSI